MRSRIVLTAALLLCCAQAASAGDYVQLNLSDGFNMDAWAGPLEIQQAYTAGDDQKTLFGGRPQGNGYDLVTTGKMLIPVSSSAGFGEPYSISGQWFHPLYVTGTQGTPEDGVLTGAVFNYHVASTLGNATMSDDTTEVADPSTYDLRSNCVMIGAAHNRADWQISSVTIELPAGQKGVYANVNFILAAMNLADKARNMRIVALYGANGTDEEVLYSFATADGGSGPLVLDASGGAAFASACTFTKVYDAASGATGNVVNTTGHLWEFATALDLNESKTLWGFKVEDTNPTLTYNARGLVIFAATAESAVVTYHVDAVNGDDDTGDGSSGAPFQTIDHVWSLLEGGETVILHDGDYGTLNVYTSYTPTPANLFPTWVTFQAAAGEAPLLEHIWIGTGTANTSDESQGRQGNYDAYLKFVGLEIEDGVIMQNARYWTFEDCLITRYGPYTGSVANIEKTAVVVKRGDHMAIQGCEITDTGTALAGYGRDFNFLDNWVHGGSHDGLRITGFWDSLIEGNLIHDFDDGVTDAEEPTWSRHCDLIHIFIPGPAYTGWQNHNVVFRGNILFDSEAQGVQFNNYYGNASLHNELITFENNVFGPTNANMFNNADPADGLIFRNNSVCKLAAARSFNRWSLSNVTLRIGPSEDVEIYDNILGSVGFDAGADVHLFDWNLIQTPGTPIGVDDQRAYGRFTLIGGAADFVDADAFDGELLDTSDAINAGTALFAPDALFGFDIVGTARDNRPDLGAWELPGLTPSAESAAPVYNDTKSCFLDDFEDGHYNDVDPWLQAANTQGLSWYRPAGYDAFKFYVTNSDTVLDRNSLAGSSSANRNSWLLSDQGSDWVDYTFEFDAHNSYLTIGSGPLVLALDPNNCYWLDISRDTGRLVRIMAGTATTLATDADIEMPHSGEQHYKVTVNVEANGITISVDVGANGSVEMTYTDTNATALSTFTAGGVGFHENTASANIKIRYDNVEVNVTDFDD